MNFIEVEVETKKHGEKNRIRSFHDYVGNKDYNQQTLVKVITYDYHRLDVKVLSEKIDNGYVTLEVKAPKTILNIDKKTGEKTYPRGYYYIDSVVLNLFCKFNKDENNHPYYISTALVHEELPPEKLQNNPSFFFQN